MTQNAICVFLLLVMCMPLASAQGTTSSLAPLSVDDAVRMAVRYNPELHTARLEVKRSDARVMESWGYTMPSVDLSGTFNHVVTSQKVIFRMRSIILW